jgi:hypothetical protein
VKKLRKAFKELSERNNMVDPMVKVDGEDFNIDPEYFEMLADRNNLKIDIARKEVAWNIEFHTL